MRPRYEPEFLLNTFDKPYIHKLLFRGIMQTGINRTRADQTAPGVDRVIRLKSNLLINTSRSCLKSPRPGSWRKVPPTGMYLMHKWGT